MKQEKTPEVKVSKEIPKRPLSASEVSNVMHHKLSRTDEDLQKEAEERNDRMNEAHKPMTFQSNIEFLEYVLGLMERYPEFRLEKTLLELRLYHMRNHIPTKESYRLIAKELSQILKEEVAPNEVRLAEIRAIGIAKDVIQHVRETCLPLVGGIGDFAGTRFIRPGQKQEEPGIIRPS